MCRPSGSALLTPNLEPQLITELADASAIVETSAITTVSKVLPTTNDLSPVEDSCAHQGFSELFVFPCFE